MKPSEQQAKAYALTIELRVMRGLLAQIDVAMWRALGQKEVLGRLYDEVLMECQKIERDYMALLYTGVPC